MADAVVTALPTALIYVVPGSYFIRGLMADSVKGEMYCETPVSRVRSCSFALHV